MRACLGLCEVSGDVVLPAPVAHVYDAPLVGLAVKSHTGAFISAHRVLLLVRGTCASDLKPLNPECQSLTAQSFRVSSKKVRCLLSSEREAHVDLHGYCDFDSMLQYRLDKDVALVLVSAWDHDETMETPVATIEHMTRVSDSSVMVEALTQEWNAALTAPSESSTDKLYSPRKSDYWDRPGRKLRRIESEATTEGM